jgi:hypothetical protein
MNQSAWMLPFVSKPVILNVRDERRRLYITVALSLSEGVCRFKLTL